MKNLKLIIYVWALFFTLGTAASCKKDAATVTPENEVVENNFVSAKFVAVIPKTTIHNLATTNGYPQFNDVLKYDVAIFSMVYKTTYQGKEIQASGLMCFPRNMPTPARSRRAAQRTVG